MKPDQRILVILTRGGMGDVLVSTPVLDALKMNRMVRIDMMVRRGAVAMVEAHPAIDELLVVEEGELDTTEGFNRWLAEVKRRRYDTALVLWSQSAEAFLVWRAGIPVRVGQSGRLTYSWTYTHKVRVRSEHGDAESHWVDCQLDYARAVGAGCPAPFPRLYISEKSQAEADQALRAAGLTRAFAVLHIGRGTPLSVERMPPAPFAAIGDAIAREFDWPVALTGGPSEIEVVNAVAGAMTKPPVVLAGKLTVGQLGGVMARARLVVANDSGPMHMAAGVGVPTVGIFAMKKDLPKRWGPWGGEIVRPTSFRCRPNCRKETCPRMDCYRDVTPEMVVAAARRALENAPDEEEAPPFPEISEFKRRRFRRPPALPSIEGG